VRVSASRPRRIVAMPHPAVPDCHPMGQRVGVSRHELLDNFARRACSSRRGDLIGTAGARQLPPHRPAYLGIAAVQPGSRRMLRFRLLGGRSLRRCSRFARSPFCSPPLLERSHDVSPSFSGQLPLRLLRCYFSGCSRRCLLCGPPLFLRIRDCPPSGGADRAFSRGRLRRWGRSIRATAEQSANLGDLFVKLLPFRGEVLERSIQNLSCELLCHVARVF